MDGWMNRNWHLYTWRGVGVLTGKTYTIKTDRLCCEVKNNSKCIHCFPDLKKEEKKCENINAVKQL